MEKNIEAFLTLDLPGQRIVTGVGVFRRADLAWLSPSVDVFVLPSRTDTFGPLMLAALACGTPLAAFPLQGPLDVGGSDAAALNVDLSEAGLRQAALHALRTDRSRCRGWAERFSWRASRAL